MKNKPFIDQYKNIYQLLREREPQTTEKSKTSSSYNSYIVKGIYNKAELERFFNKKKYPELEHGHNQANILNNYLGIISGNIKSSEEKIKHLIALNPEIRKAKQIYVASVMSPNDLQEELVEIDLSDEIDMDADLKEAVEEYLNEFFNKKHDFGGKLTEWIGEYTYEKDAKPILILPKSNIDDLTAFHKIIDDFAKEGKSVFTEEEHFSFTKQKKSLSKQPKVDAVEKIFTEAWEVFEPIVDKNNKITGKKLIRGGVEKAVQYIQDNKGCINFTTDINKVSKLREHKANSFKDKTNSFLSRMFDSYQGYNTNILSISDNTDERNFQPIVMSLPASAVIPVIIPGSPEEHMGYFVLLDEWGNPLSTFDNMSSYEGINSNITKKAYNAMFNIGNPVFNNVFTNDPQYKYEVTQSIFNIAIQHILEDKFKNNDLMDLPLKEYESLSKFLFHQMLNKNRTTILFVPESLIVYYCDTYKEDGTGQSKVNLIDFVLSLRTSLLVANVMGAMRAAIDKEVIEVTIDPKNTNPEQTIDLIRSSYIEKKSFNFTATNPYAISRSIVDAALKIVPKNFKGLDFEMNVSKDQLASEYRPADDGLLETLSNMFIDQLGVPPSSLNKLSEDEFAKSVTTNNIIFSNDIKKVQKKLKPKNKKYVSTYLKYSLYNQKDLVEIYKKFKGGNNKQELPKKDDGAFSADKKQQIQFSEDEIKFLRTVITNVEVNLPAPNIAVTKSQLEDLQSELEFINLVLDTIYNEDTIYSENQAYKDFLRTMTANIKAEKFKQIIEESTLHRNMDFEDLTKFDLTTITNKLKAVINKHKGADNLVKAIEKEFETNDNTDADEYGGSPSSSGSESSGDESSGDESSGDESGGGGDLDLDF